MRSKEHLRKNYRHFADFVAVASSKELEYVILDAKYTSGFSMMMRKVMEDIRRSGEIISEFSVLFNTNGDIAIIHADIVGRFIGDRYAVVIEDFYKNASLNKIVKAVIAGNDKTKSDFLAISYSVIYETMEELYREITCRKELLESLKERYNIMDYDREDISVVAASLMILEDICKFMEIKNDILLGIVVDKLRRK